LLDSVAEYPEALQECRDANNNHWQKIQQL
jgi:hypothetical protein